MASFDVKCPDHYPMKCNLSPADKENLVTEEKYKAFYIAQYEGNDEYLEPVLINYFENRTWRLFNAGKEAGSGTKFCKVCRFALASDFGIASLSPLNYNAFQEIGLMQGLQKPLLYLYNPTQLGKEKLPFDVDCQIYIKHTSREELEQKLDKEMGPLIDKVELYSEFEKRFRESVQQKVDSLTPDELKLLKLFLIENRSLPTRGLIDNHQMVCNLGDTGLVVQTAVPIGVKGASTTLCYREAWEVNPEYRDILREIVFKKEE